jgi:predicted RNase H-like HicB family nuclease
MRCRLAVEDIEPNHWVVWALDLPACFSSGHTRTEAIAKAPQRIEAYFAWLTNHDSSLPTISRAFEVDVVETFRAFVSEEDPEYLVNGFFEDDRLPLTYWDVEVALRLLLWTRHDLLNVLRLVTREELSRPIAGEIRGSICGILKHIAGAENWYLDQLGFALCQAQIPADPLPLLETVRANTRAQLVKLVGDERLVKGQGSELWSARKVIRRALWHECDHKQQIERLLMQLESNVRD